MNFIIASADFEGLPPLAKKGRSLSIAAKKEKKRACHIPAPCLVMMSEPTKGIQS
jgi:hypothetical protein